MRSRSVRKRLHRNQFLRLAWHVCAVAASVECVVNSGSRIGQFARVIACRCSSQLFRKPTAKCSDRSRSILFVRSNDAKNECFRLIWGLEF